MWQQFQIFTDSIGMKPRPIIPGSTYMITRRTTQRLFLMRPSRQVNRCIRYCVAIAQRRSQIKLHAVVFLSNHYHIVLSDPHGNLPLFSEELNKLVARSLNCLHGRWENFWAGASHTSYVRLDHPSDVLRKMVYALTNPTAALLVANGKDWPGERLFQPGKYQAKKPDFFFRKEKDGGVLPDCADIAITAAPSAHSPSQAHSETKRAVAEKEHELRRLARESRKRFAGVQRIRAQSIHQSPATPPPRRGLSPRLACKDKWRRIEALVDLNWFYESYQECRKAFLAKETRVVFPMGTYLMVKQFGARVAEA